MLATPLPPPMLNNTLINEQVLRLATPHSQERVWSVRNMDTQPVPVECSNLALYNANYY